jgi:hypothetical protein
VWETIALASSCTVDGIKVLAIFHIPSMVSVALAHMGPMVFVIDKENDQEVSILMWSINLINAALCQHLAQMS